jgi:hypothetical protein
MGYNAEWICFLPGSWCLIALLLFNPEDGGDMFLLNVG